MQISIFMSDLQTSTPNTESFAALFEESLTKQDMRAGEVISAEVVRVDHNFVVVSAGLKSGSLHPARRVPERRGRGESAGGRLRFRRDRRAGKQLWRHDPVARQGEASGFVAVAGKALDNNELVTGTITGRVKGGMTVMVNGIRAFLPGSLVDTRPVKGTTHYEGKTLEFRVIKLDRKRNNVVLSRRCRDQATRAKSAQSCSKR